MILRIKKVLVNVVFVNFTKLFLLAYCVHIFISLKLHCQYNINDTKLF